MEKIIFEDLPSTNTPLNADNLNQIQKNVEDEFNALFEKTSVILENSWETTDLGILEVSKVNNLVCLNLVITGGLTSNEIVITTLPEKYIPTSKRYLPLYMADDSWNYHLGFAIIGTDGKIKVDGPNGNFNNRLILNGTFQI